MSVARHLALALGTLVCVVVSACRAPGGGIMTYAQYRAVEHATPYVLEIEHAGSKLVYFGAAHFNRADDPQGAAIEWMWANLRPDLALNEGGDPPAEATRELAIGRHGEAGLLRWLAKNHGVPIRSLDPTIAQEVAALRGTFSAEDLKTFYVLRWVMQDGQRAPEFRESSPEALVERTLRSLGTIPGLEGAPRTLGEFESHVRVRAPELTDWRRVPPEWFDPAVESPLAFTNEISRAMSEFRDRFVVDALEAAMREHKRVFAAIGASHVVMQEPELRRRFERVTGPIVVGEPGSVVARPRVVSLLGKTLEPPPIPDARRAELMRKLAEYSERAAAADASEEDFIWLGRTLGYLHRYHDAVGAFTRGLARYPESHRLLRHRGHRYITLREFDRAVADLTAAAHMIESRSIPDEVEPDGAPNRSGIPRSTTNTNIYCHLGLAHYLRGEFDQAAAWFRKCLDISPNDDMTVATVHWLYMSLRRAGRDAEARAALAPIHADMRILENDAYFRLCRMYQGAMEPEAVLPVDQADAIALASSGYGVANWRRCEGQREAARALLERIAASPMWPAFGVIAAEADLARDARENP